MGTPKFLGAHGAESQQVGAVFCGPDWAVTQGRPRAAQGAATVGSEHRKPHKTPDLSTTPFRLQSHWLFMFPLSLFSLHLRCLNTLAVRKSEPIRVASTRRLAVPVLWGPGGALPPSSSRSRVTTEPSGLRFPGGAKMGCWAAAGRLHCVSLPPQPPGPTPCPAANLGGAAARAAG